MNLIELAERLECLSIGNPAITFTDKADLERAAAVLRQQAEPAPDAELLRSELDRAWREVDFISKERTEHLEWRTKLANDLDECERMRDALGVALNKRENDLMAAHNAVAQMMIRQSIATGHGDTVADMVAELEPEISALRRVAKAFKELYDAAEEWECDGLGMWAQHGWWEAADEAYEEFVGITKMQHLLHSKERPCTCHPDDNPPVPCPEKYALDECKKAAQAVPVVLAAIPGAKL